MLGDRSGTSNINHNMNILNLLTVCAVIGITSAQRVTLGRCPRTQVLQDFDVPRYLGKWYEIKKVPNFFQTGRCTEANYGPINQYGQVKVLNKEIQFQRVVAVEGFAEQDQMHHGDLLVTLRVPVVGHQQSDYDVLATNYDEWAVVHACKPILFGFKIEFAWILSRSRSLSEEQLKEIEKIFEKNGVDTKSLQSTPQDNCPNLDQMPFRLIA